jgi:hypothetical protein
MKATALLLVLIVSGLSFSVNADPGMTGKKTVISKKPAGFDAFHAHRKQTGVALAWISSSADVTSFVIQHSFDGFSFNTIDQVAPESSGWTNYEDNAALPGYNYYRIGAVLSDGSIEYSDVEVVRIVRRK